MKMISLLMLYLLFESILGIPKCHRESDFLDVQIIDTVNQLIIVSAWDEFIEYKGVLFEGDQPYCLEEGVVTHMLYKFKESDFDEYMKCYKECSEGIFAEQKTDGTQLFYTGLNNTKQGLRYYIDSREKYQILLKT